MKWTFEQKLSWAKAYMDGGFVPVPEGFSRSMGRWHDKVREWARVLLEYGEEGLNPSRQKRSFPPEAKLAAVKRVLAGEAACAVARSLGMHCPSSVLAWVRAYREKGVDGLESRPKGRKKHAQEEAQIPGAGRIEEAQAGELHADPRERLLKKLEGLGGAGGAKPRQKYEAILQTKKEFGEARLSGLLSVAGLPKSTYFYEAGRRDFDAKNSVLIGEIKEAFDSSKGRYGVRRVTAELRSLGFAVNHKKVQRLMRKAGLSAKRKTVHYNSYRGAVGKVADDLIIAEYVRKDGQVHHKSDFSCTGPNQKWTTDVSQFAFPWGEMLPQPHQGHVRRQDRRLRPQPPRGHVPGEEDARAGILPRIRPGRAHIPFRPGMAISAELVRGAAEGEGGTPIDVKEGELPGQLHHGVVLRDDEERDVSRPRSRIRELRSVREGGR